MVTGKNQIYFALSNIIIIKQDKIRFLWHLPILFNNDIIKTDINYIVM